MTSYMKQNRGDAVKAHLASDQLQLRLSSLTKLDRPTIGKVAMSGAQRQATTSRASASPNVRYPQAATPPPTIWS